MIPTTLLLLFRFLTVPVKNIDAPNSTEDIILSASFIEHAKGYLNLGEISIIIAVACKHRDEAYVLSRYLIEEIKKRSPIWKKEHYTNNQSDWLKGNPIVHEKI